MGRRLDRQRAEMLPSVADVAGNVESTVALGPSLPPVQGAVRVHGVSQAKDGEHVRARVRAGVAIHEPARADVAVQPGRRRRGAGIYQGCHARRTRQRAGGRRGRRDSLGCHAAPNDRYPEQRVHDRRR